MEAHALHLPRRKKWMHQLIPASYFICIYKRCVVLAVPWKKTDIGREVAPHVISVGLERG